LDHNSSEFAKRRHVLLTAAASHKVCGSKYDKICKNTSALARRSKFSPREVGVDVVVVTDVDVDVDVVDVDVDVDVVVVRASVWSDLSSIASS
jgi:hypothetical protein